MDRRAVTPRRRRFSVVIKLCRVFAEFSQVKSILNGDAVSGQG